MAKLIGKMKTFYNELVEKVKNLDEDDRSEEAQYERYQLVLLNAYVNDHHLSLIEFNPEHPHDNKEVYEVDKFVNPDKLTTKDGKTYNKITEINYSMFWRCGKAKNATIFTLVPNKE